MNTSPKLLSRSGTVLIIVAGVSALLATMALTFLARAKSDVRESELLIQDGQARIMLAAACSYILEASRIGWEPMLPTDPKGQNPRLPVNNAFLMAQEYVEAFGWIDVRDGTLGPHTNTLQFPEALRDAVINKDKNGNLYPVNPTDPKTGEPRENPFPVGEARRFPMHVLTRPPFAISPRVAENPINPKIQQSKHLINPDPQPAVKDFNEWAKGEVLPGVAVDGMPNYKVRTDSFAKSWFRLLREKSGASFIVTCGAGGTLGYRDWQEVEEVDYEAKNKGLHGDVSYFGSQDVFEALREAEYRLWYRVEWNAAVVVQEMNFFREGAEHSGLLSGFSFEGGGHKRSDSPASGGMKTYPRYGNNYSAQWQASNMCGSIQYIQRLLSEPEKW